MSKKGSPQAPTAPDPTTVANAQSSANIASAQAQQKLNMVGSQGPNGSVVYQADPSQPGGYTQVTTLSPTQQGLYDASNSAQLGALGLANTQLGRIGTALGQTLDPGTSSLTYGVQGGPIQSSFDTGPAIQTGYASPSLQTSFNGGPGVSYGYNSGGPITRNFSQGQAVQGQVGAGDYSQAVQSAADSSYAQATSRLDPQWNLAQQQEQAQLANQGLSQNSAAYQNAMDQFNRSKTDAYNQANFSAQQQGLAAQAQGYGQQLSSSQFANAAAGQEYSQNLGQATFQNAAQLQQNQENLQQAQFYNQAQSQNFGQNQAQAQFGNSAALGQAGLNQQQAAFNNQAAGQIYNQNLGAATFGNTAQAQQYGQDYQNATLNNQALGQGFQQTAYSQQLPINDFTALLGSGQVQMPTGISYTPSQVGQTDVTGAYALNSQAQQAAYQAQLQQQNSLMGGLFSLGSAAIKYSDARLKEDVRRVGATDAGLPIYAYRYAGSPVTEFGVLAQEVAQSRPDAVYMTPSGFLAVDYGALA